MYELNNTDVTWEQTLFRLVELDNISILKDTISNMTQISNMTIKQLLNVQDDESGTTLLMHCCESCHTITVPTYLFNNESKWDAKDKYRHTVLDYINKNTNHDIVISLTGLYYIQKNVSEGYSTFRNLQPF